MRLAKVFIWPPRIRLSNSCNTTALRFIPNTPLKTTIDIGWIFLLKKDQIKESMSSSWENAEFKSHNFCFCRSMPERSGLFIIYLETPSSKEITFHGIKDIIFKDFQNDTPDELLNLASRVYIDDIDNIMIHSIDVNGDIIILDGDGTVYIEIEYDSRSDMRNRDGLNEKLQFDFYFRLKLNHYNKKIIHSYYKIDTTWYYE